MSGSYLLDSNIIIALFAGEKVTLDRANEAEEVFVPSIVIGELYYGAQKSGKRQANIARVDRFADVNVILSCNQETARWYGRIKNQLKEKGRRGDQYQRMIFGLPLWRCNIVWSWLHEMGILMKSAH